MRRTTLAFLALFLLSALGCDRSDRSPDDSGDISLGYVSDVTTEMLDGCELSHRNGRDECDIEWQFDGSRFRIARRGDDIPSDLLSAVLKEDTTAEQIEGDWEIQGRVILLSNIQADGQDTPSEARLPICDTGVIRISTDAAQYVFAED